MACNTGNTGLSVVNLDPLLRSVAESPRIETGAEQYVHPKRPRTDSDSPLLLGTPISCPTLPGGLECGMETKKLIVSTCRSIVQLEVNYFKLEDKKGILEQHKVNGTFPKDLLLPKKKSLYEDRQLKFDEVLQAAMSSLLMLSIDDVSRKQNELMERKTTLEKDFLNLQISREAQLKFLSDDSHDLIALVNQRHSQNIHYCYSHLTITRENVFFKSNQRRAKTKPLWTFLQMRKSLTFWIAGLNNLA